MTAWPHDDLPGAGLVDEHELDAACWRKRVVIVTAEQAADMDECADWAARQRPQCVGTCETADGCSCCGGTCLTPQACEMPIACANEPPRVVDTLRRQRAITAVLCVVLGAVICAVSVAGYLRVPT